jgi:hypothetical protein
MSERLCVERIVLRADARRPGCDPEAAERDLSKRVAKLGIVLSAQWALTQERDFHTAISFNLQNGPIKHTADRV